MSLYLMGKRSPQAVPVTPEILSEALAVSDDFGHEIRVRTLLENNGCKVQHGWSYADSKLGKTRQFDLRGELRHRLPHAPWYFQFALECKNLTPSSPLIISGLPRTQEESFHDIIDAYFYPAGFPNAGVFRARDENRVYPVGGFAGKSLLRLKPDGDSGKLVPARDGESEIYDKWSQALASANDPCLSAMHAAKNGQDKVRTVVLPGVVVPDNTLWSVQYDREGRFGSGPIQTNAVSLFLNHEIELGAKDVHVSLSHVEFWTVSGLRKFLADLVKPGATWDEWYPSKGEVRTRRVHAT